MVLKCYHRGTLGGARLVTYCTLKLSRWHCSKQACPSDKPSTPSVRQAPHTARQKVCQQVCHRRPSEAATFSIRIWSQHLFFLVTGPGLSNQLRNTMILILVTLPFSFLVTLLFWSHYCCSFWSHILVTLLSGQRAGEPPPHSPSPSAEQ